jgi:hypothetical protein
MQKLVSAKGIILRHFSLSLSYHRIIALQGKPHVLDRGGGKVREVGRRGVWFGDRRVSKHLILT